MIPQTYRYLELGTLYIKSKPSELLWVLVGVSAETIRKTMIVEFGFKVGLWRCVLREFYI